MSKTSVKDALTKWEEKSGKKAIDSDKVLLICQTPPIAKMDGKLNDLVNCEHLSLSTNAIDKILPLPGLKKLKILSMSRNNIKKITGLDELSESLEELWLSYNQVEKLTGLAALKNLRVLYLSNNRIKSFDELSRLADNKELHDLLLTGNPIYEGKTTEEQRQNVLMRLPTLTKLDGVVVTPEERSHATESLEGGAAIE